MSGGVLSVLFGATVLIASGAGLLGLTWPIAAYSIVFSILFVALSQSGHTLSSFDSVSYPIEIDLCRAIVSQDNVIGMAIFGTNLCTKRIEFVPITGATSVVEFELMKAD